MRTIKQTFKVYKFDELPTDAKARAVNDEIKHLLDMPYEQYDRAVKSAVDKAEALQTPWFVAQILYEDDKDYVEQECRYYEYLEDGRIYG